MSENDRRVERPGFIVARLAIEISRKRLLSSEVAHYQKEALRQMIVLMSQIVVLMSQIACFNGLRSRARPFSVFRLRRFASAAMLGGGH